jgi:D-alanyl-D-alanine carboxypeptidase (penicillin-binding protein 5/6)
VHMAKKRRGKKRILVSFVLLLVAVGYVSLALTQPLLSIPGHVSYVMPAKSAMNVDLDWPAYGQAAIGIPGYGVVATHGSQKALPTASIAKVITAMAVLRQRPLQVGEQGPDIVLTQADVDSYNSYVAKGGSVVGVALGEHITEYQALQAMLLPSANNMATTLARWAFGSVEAFNSYANNYAKQLGLKSVHMTDPSGYDTSTVASAQDLTVIGTTAILDPVFAEIVAQPSATIPVQGKIYNYNFQLGENGNIGLKTGNNDGNKGAFLFANKQVIGEQEVIIVGTIMDGPDLATVLRDSAPLAQTALQGISNTTFITAGQKVGSYDVPGQGTVDAIASSDLVFPTWNGHSYGGSVTLDPLTRATAVDTSVGSFTVMNTTSHSTSNVPIKLRIATRAPGIFWRLSHPLGD